MKKLSVILFLLLSIQLYGCSNQASEMNEITPPAIESLSSEPETLSVEETETEENKTPAEDFHDNASDTPTETKDPSSSDYETENADAAIQATTPASEEPALAVNDNYYSAATDLPRTDVENYAAQVKQQFLDHDWPAISSDISYPITISDVTYNNSADFIEASKNFDNDLDEAFFTALEKENCSEMFCNWQGIMIGETGQIWLGEVSDTGAASQGLKIIAVNGMLK